LLLKKADLHNLEIWRQDDLDGAPVFPFCFTFIAEIPNYV
jgi:hypothetical protein